MEFTHFNTAGYARMVDVSEKNDTVRVATAQAIVRMQSATLQAIKSGDIKKRNVLRAAQVR